MRDCIAGRGRVARSLRATRELLSCKASSAESRSQRNMAEHLSAPSIEELFTAFFSFRNTSRVIRVGAEQVYRQTTGVTLGPSRSSMRYLRSQPFSHAVHPKPKNLSHRVNSVGVFATLTGSILGPILGQASR